MKKLVTAIVKKCLKKDAKEGSPWCVVGNTKIPLLDGRVLSIKDIVEEFKNKEFWVYSCKEDGQIIPGKAYNPKITRKNAEIIRIHLDNNKFLDCTMDHLIMTRNGEYKEAQYLAINDSLMPLYLKEKNYYTQVKNNRTGKWNIVYRLIPRYLWNHIFKVGEVVHHKNFNRHDNRPDNLIVMSAEDHYNLHSYLRKGIISERKGKTYEEIYGIKAKEQRQIRRVGVSQHWANQSAEELDTRKIAIKEGFTPDVRSKMSRSTSTYMSNLTVQEKADRSKKISISVKQSALRGDNHPAKRHEVRKKMSLKRKQYWDSLPISERTSTLKGKTLEEIHGIEKALEIRHKKSESAKKFWEKKKKINNFNHKVVYIEKLITKEDVYNFEVEQYENFGTDAGVFIHNCVYKHPKDSKIPYTNQPKGWPKHYKTKDDAEYGVKMMKTFGYTHIPLGWYIDTMLPTIYAKYIKNKDILDNNKILFNSIKNTKIHSFLSWYPEEIDTLKYCIPKFKKLKEKAKYLKIIKKNLKNIDHTSEALIISKIYNDLDKQIYKALLAKFYNIKTTGGITDISYDRNPAIPNPRNKSLLEGPGLAPNRGLGPRRRYYNRVKTNPMESSLPPKIFTWFIDQGNQKTMILAKKKNSNMTKSVLMVIFNKGDKFTVIVLKQGNGYNVAHFYNALNNKLQKDVIYNTIEIAKKNNYLKYVKENLSAKEFINLLVKKEGYVNIKYLEDKFPILRPYLSIEDNEGNEDISNQNFVNIGNFKVAFEDDVKKKYIDIAEDFIKRASDILQKSGLGKLLYGRVFVVDKLIGKRSADYVPNIDAIRISKKLTDKRDFLKTFIHELGHRINFKFADDAKIKEKFNSLHKGKIKVGDITTYKVRQADGTIRKYNFLITKIQGSQIHVKDLDYGNIYTIQKRYEKFFFIKKSKDGSEDKWFPSVYSKKNYNEWFAEIFAYGILKDNKLYIDFVHSVLK